MLWGLGAVFSVNAMLYFSALSLAPASVVVLLFYVYPVVVALMSAGAGIERLTVRGLAAALLAAIGAGLTAASAPALGARAGEWLAVGAAVVFALYVVLGGIWASGGVVRDRDAACRSGRRRGLRRRGVGVWRDPRHVDA